MFTVYGLPIQMLQQFTQSAHSGDIKAASEVYAASIIQSDMVGPYYKLLKCGLFSSSCELIPYHAQTEAVSDI